jgi:large subunit ribosomal protein L29
MRKISELRELPNEELDKLLAETQREIFNLRFQRETEQTEKPAEIRAAKKVVAKILTVLRERELEQAETRSGE